MKLRLTTATAALVALSTLTAGCTSASKGAGNPGAGVTPPSQGVNHPSDSATDSATPTTPASSSTAPTKPSPSPSPADTGPAKFGQKYTYKDGLVVTVAKPKSFEPSQYSRVKGAKAYVSFQITVINGTKKIYDPTAFNTSVQSGNTEAEEVFDSEHGFNGSPDTKILQNRESTFKVGFAVSNPKDLVVQVTPGFEYDDSIFTS